MKRFAFDFFNTLYGKQPYIEEVRQLARDIHAKGHEIHIVSAISPGLPCPYEALLAEMNVPWTKIHRVDHLAELKVAVLIEIQAAGFWDDLDENVEAAILAGIPSCQVGVHPVTELRRLKYTKGETHPG